MPDHIHQLLSEALVPVTIVKCSHKFWLLPIAGLMAAGGRTGGPEDAR